MPREVTDAVGNVLARYEYDPYGRRTLVVGTDLADFGYTGHYVHKPSGLHLALYRAYDADLGRWLNRDPIGEAGGINLYGYVGNDPVNWLDPTGQFALLFGIIGVIVLGSIVVVGVTKYMGKVDALEAAKAKEDDFLDDPLRNPHAGSEKGKCLVEAMQAGIDLARKIPGTSENPYFKPHLPDAGETVEKAVQQIEFLLDATKQLVEEPE